MGRETSTGHRALGFFGVTFGHIVLAILQSPELLVEKTESQSKEHTPRAASLAAELLGSPLLTSCLLAHNALCGKKAFQSPNWGKANANALFQNAAESVLLRGCGCEHAQFALL